MIADILLAMVSVLAIFACRAAYRNGVNDGYGYSREPDCYGYRAAGLYLKKHCAHRWPELSQTPIHRFVSYEEKSQGS